MSNEYYDWPAKSAAERFVAFDTVRSGDVNNALDLVSAGFEKLPTPYKVNAGSANYAADTGAADAYVVALSAQIDSYAAGLTVKFKAANTNTGASTLNVNGLGAKAIVQPDGATALAAGHILAGQMVEVQYDGTSFQLKASTVDFTNDPSAIQDQDYIAGTTGGTGTAYTLAPLPAITAYREHQSFMVRFHAASGATPTLAISGLANPPSLVKQLADGSYANIAANDIPANHRSRVTLLSDTQALVEDLVPVGRTGQCVFKYVSTIQCRLDPCNGDRIIVGGKEMRIPAAGVTVSNGGLAVSTLYYAYAYDNAGTLALEFSTAAPTDAASGLDAWGNRNKDGDTSRTLVGMVRTNASSQFEYSKTNRLVRSWFNDEGVTLEGIYASSVTLGSGPWTEVHASFRALALLWAGEQFKAEGSAVCHDAGGGAGTMYGSIGLNGAQVGRQGIVTTAGNQVYRTCGFGHASSVASDSANTFTLMGGIAAGGTPQYLGGYCSYTVNTSRKH